jgi:SAM-dependent methyltransferase
MFSKAMEWRNKGYKNIYGTNTIREWCASFQLSEQDTISVLDIGCGDGRDLVAIRDRLRSQCPVHLFGIEQTEGLALVARKHGVDTSCVDLESESLPYPDNYFDIVTANQVIEHLKNAVWALHEITRVTRRDGLIIIGAPNIAALHNRLLLACGRQPTCMKADGPHVRGFTLHELCRMVHRVEGIELLRSGGTYLYGFPPSIGKFLGRLLPGLSVTVLLAIRKTAERANVLSLLGAAERFETSFYLGKSATDVRGVDR